MQLLQFNRLMSLILIIALLLAMYPMRRAHAAVPVCTNAYAANAGQLPGCSALMLESGVPIAYPKLTWSQVGETVTARVQSGSEDIVPEASTITLANKAALALKMDAKDVVSAIQLFPANVPMVLARYNPTDKTLKIDIFKIERALVDGRFSTSMFHATFGPSHGDYWKAAKAYINPDRQATGFEAGLNPFEVFKSGNSEVFQNISISGAQVAVGHAQRLVRAPISAIAIASTRFDVTQKKSGNAFVKKITTTVKGFAKPIWLLGYPANFKVGSTAFPMAVICAQNPNATSCPIYATASAGVVFEEHQGGTLYDEEDLLYTNVEKKTGLGFLSILALAVALSFTIGGALGAMGFSAAGAGTVAGSAAASATTGVFGSILLTTGTAFISSTLVAVALETVIIGGLLMLAGANMSSVMNYSPLQVFKHVEVAAGTDNPESLNKYQQGLNTALAPLMTNDMVSGKSLSGFDRTVKGGCEVGAQLSECGGFTGVLQRTDQYIEQNQVEFLRDNRGHIIRYDGPTGPNTDQGIRN